MLPGGRIASGHLRRDENLAMPAVEGGHENSPWLNLVALAGLGIGTAVLSLRFYTSASFERSYHFSVITLLFTAAAISLSSSIPRLQRKASRYPVHEAQHESSLSLIEPLQQSIHLSSWHSHSKRTAIAFRVFNRNLSLPTSISTSALLAICTIGRTLLFWRTLRTIHCSLDCVWTLVPVILACDPTSWLRPFVAERKLQDEVGRSARRSPYVYVYKPLLPLTWAATAIYLARGINHSTGTICPPGLWERAIPLAQLIMALVDSSIITIVANMRRASDKKQLKTLWKAISSAAYASSACLLFFATFSFFEYKNWRWSFLLQAASVWDLVIDGFTASLVILSVIYLLRYHSAFMIGSHMAIIIAFCQISPELFQPTFTRLWTTRYWDLRIVFIIYAILGATLSQRSAREDSMRSIPSTLSFRIKIVTYFTLALVLLQVGIVSLQFQAHPHQWHRPLQEMMESAKRRSEYWISDAHRSKTLDGLDGAVRVYRKYYGKPPPPNFDKWHQFAISAQSSIIDTFDQIESDLLPFWGISPAELRARTDYILNLQDASISGLIIRNGKVEVWPNTPGTHMWMMEGVKSMIEPFAEWLPDMHLAFNLDDECRVSVPHGEMERYKASARGPRERLDQQETLLPFSNANSPDWSSSESELRSIAQPSGKSPPRFSHRSKSMIYSEYISKACSPESLANTLVWWNKKETCPECTLHHTSDGLIRDWDDSAELCHQPDLAYLHGFLSAPSQAILTYDLVPIFSQGRVQNFADILFPSAWNYVDKVEYDQSQSVTWPEKLNTLFWRGSASDGFATHGAWQGFLRARFVHMAATLSPRSSNAIGDQIDSAASSGANDRPVPSTDASLHLNVSFIGPFQRCDQRDCRLEASTFFSSTTLAALDAPKVEFQEHWNHRHLMDMDGAGFSGRLLPFLRSKSLPWRSGLFRTWCEERVHAWVHFVPVDVRLRELPQLLKYFASGVGANAAEEMANAGKEWADKTLRKVDMEVYMFRLLLEWGRLVDDRREEVGFAAQFPNEMVNGELQYV